MCAHGRCKNKTFTILSQQLALYFGFERDVLECRYPNDERHCLLMTALILGRPSAVDVLGTCWGQAAFCCSFSTTCWIRSIACSMCTVRGRCRCHREGGEGHVCTRTDARLVGHRTHLLLLVEDLEGGRDFDFYIHAEGLHCSGADASTWTTGASPVRLPP